MSTSKDGGPAFQHCKFVTHAEIGDGRKAARFHYLQAGMSLRDQFAGQAFGGWAAGRNSCGAWHESNRDDVAEACYQYADALIAAREKDAQ